MICVIYIIQNNLMSIQITQEQKNIIKHLQQLQKDLQYQPISESQISQPRKQKEAEIINERLELMYIGEGAGEQETMVSKRLQEYKRKSELIMGVSKLLHEYNTSFKHFQHERGQLLKLIKQIHGDTSDLIDKQRKYIDLANSIKEALDYYELFDNFEFSWVCETNLRDVFEDQLQPLLSALTDGIEFFTINSNYSNARKYCNGLLAAKTKVCSFIRSFLIKLLTKEEIYLMKNTKSELLRQIESFYPKSKPKFLLQFLGSFPQFEPLLKNILIPAKQSASEEQSNLLFKKQSEIEEFILNQHTLSLITYLQKYIPDLYQEVVLKLVTFYRIKYHQAFHKNMFITPNSNSNQFQIQFRHVLIQVIVIITCEAAYLEYMFKACSDMGREYLRGAVTKICELYSSGVVKIAKQGNRNKDPFRICKIVSQVLQQSERVVQNYLSGQYQTYVLGSIKKQLQEVGRQYLLQCYKKVCYKIMGELQNACGNMLKKYTVINNRKELTKQIKQFIDSMENLLFCRSQAEKYLINSLDVIVKSIKEVSNSIQSRIQCYVWNLEMFGIMHQALESISYSLVKKEYKIDIGQTSQIIQRVKNINQNQNIVKYATNLFSIIKTGVPTLSELTLDFNTFIKQYYQDLKQKFVKDMVYIYAKNIIEFLQQLRQLTSQPQQHKQHLNRQSQPKEEQNQQQIHELCENAMLLNLYSSFKININNFIRHANSMLELRSRQFPIFQQGQSVLISLFQQIQEALLDIMGTFYVETSKYSQQVEQFDQIADIRAHFIFNKADPKGPK